MSDKFRQTDREKTDFDQTLEAARRLKQYEVRIKLGIAFVLGWLFAVIMICAYLGVKQ